MYPFDGNNDSIFFSKIDKKDSSGELFFIFERLFVS